MGVDYSWRYAARRVGLRSRPRPPGVTRCARPSAGCASSVAEASRLARDPVDTRRGAVDQRGHGSGCGDVNRVTAPAGHRWCSPLASLDRHLPRISARHHRGRACSLGSGLWLSRRPALHGRAVRGPRSDAPVLISSSERSEQTCPGADWCQRVRGRRLGGDGRRRPLTRGGRRPRAGGRGRRRR